MLNFMASIFRPSKKLLVFIVVAILLSSCKQKIGTHQHVNVVMIGAGIMSATLASMLRELDENLFIEIYEKLDDVALESSAAWNNAGTGHAAYAELNYTPISPDGKVNMKKAIEVHEAFEISKQYWSYLVEKQIIENPRTFINSIPHMSFVWGDENVSFLKARHETLIKHPFFSAMQYSEDRAQIEKWVPLIMEGRSAKEPVAATRIDEGTDVNFGSLTKSLFDSLLKKRNTKLFLSHEVTDIARDEEDQTWTITFTDHKSGDVKTIGADFVFIGAGGGALPLLQKADIPESKGYGGFPVGGVWLVTDREDLINRHNAKVYGKASVGSPPMSVPHLDTRIIDGKKALFFGPFATSSTKFLKHGSWLDLPLSISFSNFIPMLQAGFHNFDLVKYLIQQVLMSDEEKLAALKEYMPTARLTDWRTEIAGQRVQIIRDDEDKGGTLEFGTQLVGSKDGSIVALLGASPGASIAVKIMLDLLEKSFPKELKTEKWQKKLGEMIPSYRRILSENPDLIRELRARSKRILGV